MFDFNLMIGLNAIEPKDVDVVICRDLENLSSTTEKCYEYNVDAYNVVLNLWLHLVSDNSSPSCAEVLKRQLMRDGLTAAIKDSSISNSEVLSGLEPKSQTWKMVLDEIRKKYGARHYGFGFLNETLRMDSNIFRIFNTLTKFPKRFTPTGADLLEKKTWKSYLDNQNRMSNEWIEGDTLARAGYIELVRSIIREIVPWDKVCDIVEGIMKDPDAYKFTPGVTADAKRSHLSKLKVLNRFAKDHSERHHFSGFNFSGNWEEEAYSKGMVVPKNNETGRVISPEQTVRASKGKAIFEVLATYLPAGIYIYDQEVNQMAALLGSDKNTVYDTLDQSKASDSQTWPLFFELYPTRFTELVRPLLADFMVIPKNVSDREKIRTMTAMAMGHPLTFILECLTFFACGLAGILLTSSVTLQEARLPKKITLDGGKVTYLNKVLIVGDDMAIISEYTEATMHVLTSLGFLLNEEKSFVGDHPYRESCGKEYFDGDDVTPIYYPRSPLGRLDETSGGLRWDYNFKMGTSEPTDNLARLVELQHRVIAWSFHANNWICAVIKQVFPDMTESEIGSTYSDIWVTNPDITKKYSPYAFITEYYTGSSSRRNWVKREDVKEVTVTSWKIVSPDEYKFWQSGEDKWSRFVSICDNALDLYSDTRILPERILDCGGYEELVTVREFYFNKLIEARKKKEECMADPIEKTTYFTMINNEQVPVHKARKAHLVSLPNNEESYLEGHAHPSATYPDSGKLTAGDINALCEWSYYRFLKSGPEYLHPADTLEGQIERTAGISTNPYLTKAGNPRNSLSGEVKLTWKI